MAAIRPSLEVLQACMKNPECVRNVCILAHVDHGKTTIADSLLATNRLVSKRMAGALRYLDDRLDEQERGITMKSSAVSLYNSVRDPYTGEVRPMLLNLVDTPGHIDFSSEVCAALRVCDGALIVVDLVEGVCVQTREAIKHAFAEKCKMVLLLNKFDKLTVELHKEVDEIFPKLLHAIEDCNAIVAELYQYEQQGDTSVDIEDTGLLFSPETGNVIFASAIDGWGFTTKDIAAMFVNKIKGQTLDSLNKTLWNFDAYVDSKTNTVKLGAIEKNKTNLFTQLCLKTIVHIYTTIVIEMDKQKVEKIAQKLNITSITRDMLHNDPKVRLRAVMQSWCPLAETIMLQCLDVILPPSQIDETRIKYLLDYDRFCEEEEDSYPSQCIERAVPLFKACSPTEETCSAYVAKMFCVDKRNLSQNSPKPFVVKPRQPRTNTQQSSADNNNTEIEKPLGKQEENHASNGTDKPTPNQENGTSKQEDQPEEQSFAIIALAKVFTGSLKVGQEIYVLSPRYVPTPQEIDVEETGKSKGNKCIQRVKIKELYILFGRDLVLVDQVTAGNICGIGGLEAAVVRTATLSSTRACVPFVEHPSTPPIVRNAIEPVHPQDLPILRKGLRTLMQSDSCVQVMIEDTGEYVLVTAGDVHLAKCLEDLKTTFAKIDVDVSSPMVSLRETVNHSHFRRDLEKTVQVRVGQIQVTAVVVSLPNAVATEIERNFKLARAIEEHQLTPGFRLYSKRQSGAELSPATQKTFKSDTINASAQHFKQQLNKSFDSAGHGMWHRIKTKIWSVGRSSDSINVLFNAVPDYSRSIFETLDERDQRSCFDHLVVNAFISFCKSGPLCAEPVKNCAVLVKEFQVLEDDKALQNNTRINVNIESTLSAAFREAFQKQQQKLMEPVFTTSIQVNTNILGKVYSVVSKRHGKVLDAVCMDEQEKSFQVKAQIPVVESTGFANEIRKTTSGQAIPTLKFSHFEIIDGDPFYEPSENNNDEDEDPIKVENSVRATKLRKEVRKRKGLYVEEQVVVHAEKQRTLNKKK